MLDTKKNTDLKKIENLESVDIARYEGTLREGLDKVYTFKTCCASINVKVLEHFEMMMCDFEASESLREILEVTDVGIEELNWKDRDVSVLFMLRLARLFAEAALAPFDSEVPEIPKVVAIPKPTKKSDVN